MRALFICTSLLLASATILSAFQSFSHAQLRLLKDPTGWDYVKMDDTGMRTDHPCFNGEPPTDECSGRLVFGTDNHFLQEVTIHGQTVPRHGTYTLSGDQLTFVDELKTPDGPYTVAFDPETHHLIVSMPQVRIELVLHKAIPMPNKGSSLTAEQLKLLKDPYGWDYVKIVDDRQGINQTCSDTPQNGGQCYGRIVLGSDNKFVQTAVIRNKATPRRGTYKLENDQLTLVDEQGNEDGPYTIEVDTLTKTLAIYAPQLRTEFESHKARLDKTSKDSK